MQAPGRALILDAESASSSDAVPSLPLNVPLDVEPLDLPDLDLLDVGTGTGMETDSSDDLALLDDLASLMDAAINTTLSSTELQHTPAPNQPGTCRCALQLHQLARSSWG